MRTKCRGRGAERAPRRRSGWPVLCGRRQGVSSLLAGKRGPQLPPGHFLRLQRRRNLTLRRQRLAPQSPMWRALPSLGQHKPQGVHSHNSGGCGCPQPRANCAPEPRDGLHLCPHLSCLASCGAGVSVAASGAPAGSAAPPSPCLPGILGSLSPAQPAQGPPASGRAGGPRALRRAQA